MIQIQYNSSSCYYTFVYVLRFFFYLASRNYRRVGYGNLFYYYVCYSYYYYVLYSCLDHIFIKTNNLNSNEIVAGVIQTFITDHFSTFTAVPISNKPKYENTIIKRNVNYNLFCTLLKQEDWSFLNNSTNAN